MKLKINSEKLRDIMSAFYALTGIKIIIFDENREEVFSYPGEDCSFCRMMKSDAATSKLCADCDARSFEECKRTGSLKLYTCYAGLVEACAPLKQGDKVIGYIMFGQISDLPSDEALRQNVSDVCREYSLDEEKFLEAARDIKIKSYENIMSAAKIFEACISYIILNDMLEGTEDKIITESEKYIDEHIAEVSVSDLCRYLRISRTALYAEFKDRCPGGVSAFIKKKRFERAKSLLEETDLAVMDIARDCGFYDYNYFSRVFKARYGKSPRELRRTSKKKAPDSSEKKRRK